MVTLVLLSCIVAVLLGVAWLIYRETSMAVERRNRKAARRTERRRDLK